MLLLHLFRELFRQVELIELRAENISTILMMPQWYHPIKACLWDAMRAFHYEAYLDAAFELSLMSYYLGFSDKAIF